MVVQEVSSDLFPHPSESQAKAEKSHEQQVQEMQQAAAQKLKEEAARTEAAQKRAEEATHLFEAAQAAQAAEEEARRREMLALRDKKVEGEKKLQTVINQYESSP